MHQSFVKSMTLSLPWSQIALSIALILLLLPESSPFTISSPTVHLTHRIPATALTATRFSEFANRLAMQSQSQSNLEAQSQANSLPPTSLPDPEQSSSITTLAPAVLLNAGPGTGKSRVLAARTAYVVSNFDVKPEEVVILSFTKKDADSIRSSSVRMLKRLGYFDDVATTEQDFKDNMWAGTFHSFSNSIIRKYGSETQKNRRIITSSEQREILKEIVTSLTLSDSSSPSASKSVKSALADLPGIGSLVYNVQKTISFWKEASCEADSDCIVPIVPKSAALASANISPLYEKKLLSLNAIDAGDLIPTAVSLLMNNENVLNSMRGRLKQCVVDEFQDVSRSQHRLLKLLINGHHTHNSITSTAITDVPKLFAAGDTDQSIYGWRGANPKENIGMFLHDFPQGVILPFGTSYRLPRTILTAASSLIKKRDSFGSTNAREEKNSPISKIKAFETSPAEKASKLLNGGVIDGHEEEAERVVVRGLWDSGEEGRWIASQIIKKFKERKRRAEECGNYERRKYFDTSEVAILVRSTDQIRDLAEGLADVRVPFFVDGQTNWRSKFEGERNFSNPLKRRDSRASDENNDLINREEIRIGLNVLGGCVDGEFIDDVDFARIYEQMGGFLEDLYADADGDSESVSSTNIPNAQSLFDKTIAKINRTAADDKSEKETAVAKSTIKFIKKWNRILTSKGYLNTESARIQLLSSCLGEAQLLSDGQRKEKASLSELCEMASKCGSLGGFVTDIRNNNNSKDSTHSLLKKAGNEKFGANRFDMAPVRILTMHRAKGCEFDDVYLAGWEEGIFPQPNQENDVDEERRLAYVALTRSRQRATITYAGRRVNTNNIKNNGQKASIQRPSRFLLELRNRSLIAVTARGKTRSSFTGAIGGKGRTSSLWLEGWIGGMGKGGDKKKADAQKTDLGKLAMRSTKQIFEKVTRSPKPSNAPQPESRQDPQSQQQKQPQSQSPTPSTQQQPQMQQQPPKLIPTSNINVRNKPSQKRKKPQDILIDLLIDNEQMDMTNLDNIKSEIELTRDLLRHPNLSKNLMKQIFRTKLADNFGITRGRCIVGTGEKTGETITRPLSASTGPQIGLYYWTLLKAERKWLRREAKKKQSE